eukprot:gene8184-5711_t
MFVGYILRVSLLDAVLSREQFRSREASHRGLRRRTQALSTLHSLSQHVQQFAFSPNDNNIKCYSSISLCLILLCAYLSFESDVFHCSRPIPLSTVFALSATPHSYLMEVIGSIQTNSSANTSVLFLPSFLRFPYSKALVINLPIFSSHHLPFPS